MHHPDADAALRPLLINLRDAAPQGAFERVLEVVPADPAAREPLRARWKHYQTPRFRAQNLTCDAAMTTLDSGFNPQSFETRLYAQWESSGAFAPTGNGPAYTILLPPPNVTGTLHMGHAFQHTLMDALRYHRMRGYRTLWQMGTDHAGIATEMVGRNLAIEGKGETRDPLGRDKFIEKVWEWKHSGDTIERQMRRLGASGDWSRSVFTMDPMPSKAIIEAFVRLHEEGLIYRGQRLVNWDPVLKPRFRTSKWSARRNTARRGRCAIHWPMARLTSTWKSMPTAWKPCAKPATIWWWPPPARKPCSAIPPRWCTRKTRATSRCTASVRTCR